MIAGFILSLSAALIFVAYRLHRSRQNVNRLDSLCPLGAHTLQILRELERIPLLTQQHAYNISIKELIKTLRNFRAMAHTADLVRLQNPQHEKEFSALHCCIAENGKNMTVRLVFAILEKIANQIFGSSSQLYACAALATYSDEVHLVVDLLELGGDQRSQKLEAHLA